MASPIAAAQWLAMADPLLYSKFEEATAMLQQSQLQQHSTHTQLLSVTKCYHSLKAESRILEAREERRTEIVRSVLNVSAAEMALSRLNALDEPDERSSHAPLQICECARELLAELACVKFAIAAAVNSAHASSQATLCSGLRATHALDSQTAISISSRRKEQFVESQASILTSADAHMSHILEVVYQEHGHVQTNINALTNQLQQAKLHNQELETGIAELRTGSDRTAAELQGLLAQLHGGAAKAKHESETSEHLQFALTELSQEVERLTHLLNIAQDNSRARPPLVDHAVDVAQEGLVPPGDICSPVVVALDPARRLKRLRKMAIEIQSPGSPMHSSQDEPCGDGRAAAPIAKKARRGRSPADRAEETSAMLPEKIRRPTVRKPRKLTSKPAVQTAAQTPLLRSPTTVAIVALPPEHLPPTAEAIKKQTDPSSGQPLKVKRARAPRKPLDMLSKDGSDAHALAQAQPSLVAAFPGLPQFHVPQFVFVTSASTRLPQSDVPMPVAVAAVGAVIPKFNKFQIPKLKSQ